MQISLTNALSLTRLHPRKSMPSMTRFGRPPRSLWPQVATAFAALLLSGAACADMVGGLLVSPTSLNFGSVALGATSPAQQVTVTNTTSAPIGPLGTNSGVGGSPWGVLGAGCNGTVLAPGASCSNSYTFTPTALGTQTSSGKSFGINGVSVPLSFTGNGVSAIAPGSLLVTPSELNFGDVPVGATSAFQPIMLTNISGADIPLTFTGGSTVGSGFAGLNGSCGATLTAGASCDVRNYAFAPTSAGAQTASPATLTINGADYPVTLKGNGVQGLKVTPANLDFGPVPVGATSASQAIMLTNISGADIPLTFTGGSTVGSEFAGFNGGCGATLTAGASCDLRNYAFAPISAGVQTASVATLTVNGADYPVTLRGIGTNGAPLVAPFINSAPPPGGTTGAPYNFTVTAIGTAPFTFSDAGTLPPGLAINPSTGAITGTPSAAGSYSVTLTAANGILPNGAQAFTMDIALAPVGSVTAVPTLGEWGLLLMACLVGGAGWWQVRRRTTSRWPAA